MNRSFSPYSSSSAGSSTSCTSFGDPIHAPTLIVSARMIHDNDTLLVNKISFVLTERDVDHLHDHYQISQEIFQIYTLNLNVRVDDQILTEATIMVYEE